jgi:hypothetical protein
MVAAASGPPACGAWARAFVCLPRSFGGVVADAMHRTHRCRGLAYWYTMCPGLSVMSACRLGTRCKENLVSAGFSPVLWEAMAQTGWMDVGVRTLCWAVYYFVLAEKSGPVACGEGFIVTSVPCFYTKSYWQVVARWRSP